MAARTVAIVLAAGAGSRFGGGKLLASLGGRPVLQHVLDRLDEAGLGEVIVVLGREADAIEGSMAWRSETRVLNAHPERGLASSLLAGMRGVAPDAEAALIVLGDQPLVSSRAIRALLDAPEDPDRPFVVPVHAGDRARNPVLIRRSGFDLARAATGDRGLGPTLAEHPALVQEISIEGDNPDIDTPADLARVVEADWGNRVRANRAQVERVREIPDGADFYAPVRSIFHADPTRTDDQVLNILLGLVRPRETWLDVGAGAGRYALPIARALAPSGGSVVAIDPSVPMLDGLREIALEFGIGNVRTIVGRWPSAAFEAMTADVTLIAHVGYDVEAIGPFVDALEDSARRLCVAVLMDGAPPSAADAFWPLVHGVSRVPLPSLRDFIDLLRARRRDPEVAKVTLGPRRFDKREAIEGAIRRQLWIAPSGPREASFQRVLDELTIDTGNGWVIRDRPPDLIGIVTWRGRA